METKEHDWYDVGDTCCFICVRCLMKCVRFTGLEKPTMYMERGNKGGDRDEKKWGEEQPACDGAQDRKLVRVAQRQRTRARTFPFKVPRGMSWERWAKQEEDYRHAAGHLRAATEQLKRIADHFEEAPPRPKTIDGVRVRRADHIEEE